MLFAFFYHIDICTNVSEQSWVKLLAPSQVGLRCTSGPIFYHHINYQNIKEKKPISFINILEVAVEIINIIKCEASGTYSLNILFGKGKLCIKYLHTEEWQLPLGKALKLFELWAELVTFHRMLFIWKNDKLMIVIQIGDIWWNISSMSRVSLSLQEKEMTTCIAKDKIGVSKWKIRVLENLSAIMQVSNFPRLLWWVLCLY